jgi:hypothetical protein
MAEDAGSAIVVPEYDKTGTAAALSDDDASLSAAPKIECAGASYSCSVRLTVTDITRRALVALAH